MKVCSISIIVFLIQIHYNYSENNDHDKEQCTLEGRKECDEIAHKTNKYTKSYNEINQQIQDALDNYTPCTLDVNDSKCACYTDVISRDLAVYQKQGITQAMIAESAKYGTRYTISKGQLFRDVDCMFPARCIGIEYFLLRLLPQLPDMDLVVNTRDYPQLRAAFGATGPVFSFSKTSDYRDIMYPAWTFWAGGPAISLHPTGIGRWDLLRKSITEAAVKMPWSTKLSQGFFRGSRTSDERDSLVLLSRRSPKLVDAQYTKNQAWKSHKDTLNAEPATEVSFEQHCRYKYLFNFRGIAASFRLKHLFLCNSLVFHVGDDWKEFFYFALKPWVHYVPLKSYPSESELEEILLFFREHDDLAQQIAQRGYDFIWQHLRMEDVECYWDNVLKRYQKLLQYKVNVNKDLVEITSKAK